MIESWRWFGPKDPVSLEDIRQTGATNVVTALHELPNGVVWSVDAIKSRQQAIESKGLTWDVVESVPVHENIKIRTGNYQQLIENYQQTLFNLGQCGIKTVCYNFMPVLDWTRTDLAYELPDGSKALYFDQIDFAAFELFILQRDGADNDYTAAEIQQAKLRFEQMTVEQKKQLQANIIMGLPGAEESYSLDDFRAQLLQYQSIDAEQLREHLMLFLKAVVPAAKQAGVNLAIHPDDPPRPILGLPRVVSTIEDMDAIRRAVDMPENGFTFCTGSYGVRADNELVGMITSHADRIYFVHLRSTQRLEHQPKSFYEASHLAGDVNMYRVVKRLLEAENIDRSRQPIYFRPDHGHQILDDLNKNNINPGYSCIGRLKGLAELRGMIHAIQCAENEKHL